MKFEIVSYQRVGELRFGTSKCMTAQALGHIDRIVDTADGVIELYNFSSDIVAQLKKASDQLIEIGFGRRSKGVSYGDILFFEQPAREVVRRLCKLDQNALVGYGVLVFLNLGLSLSGFLEDEDDTKAITVFARGVWDDIVPSMKPYSC